MVHQIDTVHWFSGLPRPRSVVANGGIYLWKDGRKNWDTMTAVFDYGTLADSSKGFQVVYSSRQTNSAGDVKEREHWDEYMDAYQECIEHTSTEDAPWYVIPADHKWYMRMAVAEIIAERLEDLALSYPAVDEHKEDEVAAARKMLEGE